MRMKAVRVRSGTTRMRPPDPELIHRYAHCRSSVLVSLLCHCRCYTNWRCPSIIRFPRLRWPKQPTRAHDHDQLTPTRSHWQQQQ